MAAIGHLHKDKSLVFFWLIAANDSLKVHLYLHQKMRVALHCNLVHREDWQWYHHLRHSNRTIRHLSDAEVDG
jgi:hypothetical protein